jgi:hypothetical protein
MGIGYSNRFWLARRKGTPTTDRNRWQTQKNMQGKRDASPARLLAGYCYRWKSLSKASAQFDPHRATDFFGPKVAEGAAGFAFIAARRGIGAGPAIGAHGHAATDKRDVLCVQIDNHFILPFHLEGVAFAVSEPLFEEAARDFEFRFGRIWAKPDVAAANGVDFGFVQCLHSCSPLLIGRLRRPMNIGVNCIIAAPNKADVLTGHKG